MPTFSPPIAPSTKSNETVNFRLLRNEFGEGYEQVTKDGLNSVRRAFSLTFEVLTDAEVDDIMEFFITTLDGSESFTYTVPGDSQARDYRLDGDITRNYLDGGLNEVSFKIKEAFVL